MKKLTLILSTVLLMSSTAAFAKSKTANLNVNMINSSDCLLAKSALDTISILEKDVNFAGKCEGANLVGRLRIRYNVTPTQKYKLQLGGRWFQMRENSLATAKALGMVFGKDVSISAKYNQVYTTIWISGEISLK